MPTPFLRLVAASILALFAACSAGTSPGALGTTDDGSGDGTPGGAGGATSGAGGSGSTSTSSTTSGSAGGAGGSALVVPLCRATCGAPSDCATPNVPAYDASHYTCDSGLCTFLGCTSADECTTLLAKKAGCTALNGSTLPTCTPACQTPSDCATPGTPAYDASHYACENGLCRWLGCTADAECSAMLSKPGVCAKLGGVDIKACVPACNQAADCAAAGVPAYDASHYACDNGACTYTGCHSDAECKALVNKDAYACR